jgi:hypothetical protein
MHHLPEQTLTTVDIALLWLVSRHNGIENKARTAELSHQKPRRQSMQTTDPWAGHPLLPKPTVGTAQ